MVERSLPTPDIRGSNPNICKSLSTNCTLNRKEENKENDDVKGPPYKKMGSICFPIVPSAAVLNDNDEVCPAVIISPARSLTVSDRQQETKNSMLTKQQKRKKKKQNKNLPFLKIFHLPAFQDRSQRFLFYFGKKLESDFFLFFFDSGPTRFLSDRSEATPISSFNFNREGEKKDFKASFFSA